MRVHTKKSAKKTLLFEENEEEISLEIELKNVTTQISNEAIVLQLKTLFSKVIKTLELD